MEIGEHRSPDVRPCLWGLIVAAGLLPPAAIACSTMALGPSETPLLAYSYDTSATGAGYVVVNPPDATRASIMENSTATWQTLFGSVSFNQMGPGMPTAGMNTAGVFVSLMWNDAARFPPVEGPAILNELEVIQRVLDRAANVDEAIGILGDADVHAMSRIHYFVADATGRTAAVLPTPDGPVVHVDGTMPVRALTNTSYRELLHALSGYEGFGGVAPRPTPADTSEPDSVERFVLAASASQPHRPVTPQDAFMALDAVENSETRWQIVAEPGTGAIAFRLKGSEQAWRIDATRIDYACRPTPLAQSLDVQALAEQGIRFQPLVADQLGHTLFEVLAGFALGIGVPVEAAWPIAEAQLQALTCAD